MNELLIKASKYVKHLLREKPTAALLLQLKQHDEYTYTHSINVAIYTAMLMDVSNIPHKRDTVQGALLHDIGKIDIPLKVLQKKEKLNTTELKLIKHHPTYTYQILKENNFPLIVQNIGLYHHEKLNGSGYPMMTKEISKNVQIVTICDMYDAITSDRPYHKGASKEEAFIMLYEAAKDNLINEEYLKLLETIAKENGLNNKIGYKNETTIGTITFTDAKQIFKFVTAMERVDFNAYLYTEKDIVNAKSLISVCRIASTDEMALTIDSGDEKDITIIKGILKDIIRVA